nr:glycosyltransferase [Methylotetracoccus sp.]
SDIDENLELISPQAPVAATDDTYGFRFACENAEDLRRKMDWLLQNPAAAQHVGLRAYERVATEFDWERIAQQYLAVFERAMRGGPR